MKSFKQFLSESVNISGSASVGTIVINTGSNQLETQKESFLADIIWEGNMYRIKIEGKIMNRTDLAEQIQSQYPGAIVHQVYPIVEKDINIINSQRYHPSKLEWID